MHPLALIFLIIGIPALIALLYIFIRGSSHLRRYVLTRIALTIPMILILASLVFFVLRVLPGDPVTSALGPKGSAEVKEEMRTNLGLNDPLIVQYGRFLGSVLTLDLGNSMTLAQRPVVDELGERLPATLELIIPATVFALTVGLIFGTIAAVRRKKASDYGFRLYSVAIYAMPVFWLGLIMQLVFGVWLGWTPTGGRVEATLGGDIERTTNMLSVDTVLQGNWEAFGSVLHHMILPTLTLGLILSGVFLRLTRINVIETNQEDYITAARARGIRERTITYSHALKNAMIPVITLIGLQVAILLGGAILTETVFSWPGMGRYLVQRISSRDFTAVQGSIVMFALFVAMISLAVDIIYSLLDPRVKY